MPQKPTIIHPDSRDASSAPEVPHEVAKQYGLHHETKTESKTNSSAVAAESAEDPAIENAETDAAVDDIVSAESDQLLADQDSQTAGPVAVRPKGFGAQLRRFFAAWWRNKWARWITIIILTLGAAAAAIIPQSRYAVLNTVGVRSKASVIVVDSATQLPLRHVSVQLGDKKTETDRDGVARLTGLKLGSYDLTVSRIAFAPQKQRVTIGWGSNPLGVYRLQAVGTQYVIRVTDYVSGKPVAGAEADAEILNALSDREGKILLTVGDTDVTKISLTLNAAGYRTEKTVIEAVNAEKQIALVPSQKVVFASKQSGKYDVFSADLDGKNQRLLLAGTGRENNTISLVVSPDNKQAALVSTREALRDSDGYQLHSLTFINIETGASSTVDRAQQIQLVDWLDKRLIYRSTVAGASAANPGRNKLVSYNHETNARTQLAAANQFNAVTSASGFIYYGSSGTDPSAALGLFRVKPDGSGREQLTNQEVWTGLRTTYDTLAVQTPNGWYDVNLNDKKVARSQPPASMTNLQFAVNSGGKQAAWTAVHDGKNALLMRDASGGAVKTLVSKTGISGPVRWLSDSMLTYRVVTSTESAEYAVSTLGGQPRKIIDVAAVYGYAQIY